MQDSNVELDEVPELLDFTEELLLESVDGLDFAEEELFFDEDETLLSLLLDPFDSACASLRVTPEEESSPQAVRLIVAIRARMGREKNFMSRGR